jgi:hypothetical protein
MTALDRITRAAQFVTKLLQLTQEKRIEWRPLPSPRDDGRTAFEAEIEGKHLRLYRYQKEADPWLTFPLKGRTAEVTCLELLEGDLVTYTFEGTSGLRDLYESAAYATSDVESLMDAVLEKS